MKTSSPRTDSPRTPPAALLAAWFEESARPLPWRETYDPYHVWISEAMLQQTQVVTVLPYYERFLTRFPTLADLADAPEEDVLRLWAGLGYYSRARNLHRAAGRIQAEHAGRVPADVEALLALPGIGRYMAGAIASIAYNRPAPIVDGNVRRVLSRIHGWENPTDKQIWAAAEDVVRAGEPRVVNQAMMELGARLCTPRAPRCGDCPWQAHCLAFRMGQPEALPAPRKRPTTVHVERHAVIDGDARGFLMRQEKGFWVFPLLDHPPDGARKLGACRHTITHHRIHIHVYAGRPPDASTLRRTRIEDVPVSSMTRKILGVFESGGGGADHPTGAAAACDG